MTRAERWYRRLLWAYPAAFRERFHTDLLETFHDHYAARARHAGRLGRAAFWMRLVADTIRYGLEERALARRARRPLPLGAHRAKGSSPMSRLAEDVRHAGRALRHHRGFTTVIVLTLALGIGANSAMFTVINAVLLRPLPFDRPDHIVMLREVDPRGRDSLVSAPNFEDWQRQLRTFEALSLYAGQTANLTGVAEPDRLRAGFVNGGFFGMLGVQPIIGRAFAVGEDKPGVPKTALLAYSTWATRFGSDPAILGRALVLNNEPHEVIGVLPPRFEFPIDDLEVWLPLSSYPVQRHTRQSRNYLALGRVRADVSLEAAAAELTQLSAGLAQAFPDTNANWSARLQPFHEVTVGSVRSTLTLLGGAVLLVLFIACANIANLLLVRASGRQREMAVRVALGASPGRLVWQLLLESLVMATAGGGLGLVLGGALTDGMLSLVPNLPRVSGVGPDASVVLFTAALSMLTGLVFGIIPALRTSRTDVRASLTESGRTGDSAATGRLRAGLIVAELALSLVLLVGAGLLVQSLYRVLSVDKGYRSDHLLTLEYRLPRNKYQTAAQQSAMHARVLEQISRVPGIGAASLALAAPQSGNGSYIGYWKADDPRPSDEAMPRAQFNSVTPDFFRAMGTPVIAGRVCTEADTPEAPLGMIVNRHLAETLWPGDDPIGKTLRGPDFPGAVSVMGVVANTRPRLLSMPVTGQIYGCFSQQPGLFATVIGRTTGEPMAVARSVQHAIWSVDADQPMWKIRSGETLVNGSIQTGRFVMLLMSSAAGLALLLAALGTYSVLSYTVQRRAREVGVRMALGATRLHVMRLVLSQTAVLTVLGIGIGLAGSLALSRLLTTALFDVSPRDPWTFAATSMLLAGVALVAAWLPTRRATRVDPMITLRAE